jgi:hypothetical protein
VSTIVAPTRMLVGLLSDLLLTASVDPDLPEVRGVLLHTTDGEFAPDAPAADDGEQPLIDAISTDLLVGTSTDCIAVGQAHMPVKFAGPAGWLRPAFVELPDVRAVVAAFKPLISTLGKEVTHRCELELSAGTLTICEDPDLVPSGLRMSFAVGDDNSFPRVTEKMQPDLSVAVTGLDREIIDPSYGTGFSPRYLEAFGKIGRRRQMPLAMYRHHQRRAVVVEIGSSYRGAVQPYELDEDHGQHLAPTVRVFTPPVRDRHESEAV